MGVQYTAVTVAEITERIEEITDGRFRGPYVTHPGDGENFVDTNKIVSWRSADDAAAYYLGIWYGVTEEPTEEPFRTYRRGLDREFHSLQFALGLEDARSYRRR